MISDDDLRARAATSTIREISDDLDIPYDSVRAMLNRRNIRARREAEKSLLDKADEMPPKEARDFLMQVVSAMFALTLPNAEHPVYEIPGLAPVERAILARLMDGGGRTVPVAALVAAASVASKHFETMDRCCLRVHISHLRKKLPPQIGRIVVTYGEGYRLERDPAQLDRLVCNPGENYRLERDLE
ncbi:MAG: winged helix-turn-helix domain-containing protein [Loktanella sp.]|nr:winged helix-turn-helix domain-containing protein [Loktanella sp.]